MYKIKNDSKRALHINGRFAAVMPGEEVEVDVLPENLTFWKVVSKPQPEIKEIKKEKRGKTQ